MTRVIICDEKHSREIWNASSLEELAKSSLAILTERFNAGWYQKYEQDVTNVIMSQEQIDAIPDPEIRRIATSKRALAAGHVQYIEEQHQFYKAVKQVVEQKDLSTITIGSNKYARQVPVAWNLLDMHSDYEYERVELIEARVA